MSLSIWSGATIADLTFAEGADRQTSICHDLNGRPCLFRAAGKSNKYELLLDLRTKRVGINFRLFLRGGGYYLTLPKNRV